MFCGSASDSVSYNSLGSKQNLEYIFQVGVRQEKQKLLSIPAQL